VSRYAQTTIGTACGIGGTGPIGSGRLSGFAAFAGVLDRTCRAGSCQTAAAFGSGPPAGALEAIKAADELGWDSTWTAEAYGSDALTPLAWWGAHTEKIGLGTAIMQMSARTPTAAAMAALSMDHLSGGRFRLGIGASGPQVVEGWYGQPYPRPLERTREYVDVIRQVLAREAPVTIDGRHYQLPLEGGAGLGKALKPFETFDVAASVPIVPHEDVDVAASFIKPMIALYVGGMGAKGANFHFDVFARQGWEGVCHTVQDLYLDGKKDDAIAAIPTEMIEDIALVGPPDKIKDELLGRWSETCITTLLVSGDVNLVRQIDALVNG